LLRNIVSEAGLGELQFALVTLSTFQGAFCRSNTDSNLAFQLGMAYTQ